MSNIKEVHCTLETKAAGLCQPINWSMTAILGDSATLVVMHTQLRAISLAMITMRKSMQGFAFLPYMRKVLRLAGAPPLYKCAAKLLKRFY